jgi:hypothetical protein
VAKPPPREAQPSRNDKGEVARAFREHTPPSTLWSYGELNPGPLACHASALPTELQPRVHPVSRRATGRSIAGDRTGNEIASAARPAAAQATRRRRAGRLPRGRKALPGPEGRAAWPEHRPRPQPGTTARRARRGPARGPEGRPQGGSTVPQGGNAGRRAGAPYRKAASTGRPQGGKPPAGRRGRHPQATRTDPRREPPAGRSAPPGEPRPRPPRRRPARRAERGSQRERLRSRGAPGPLPGRGTPIPAARKG